MGADSVFVYRDFVFSDDIDYGLLATPTGRRQNGKVHDRLIAEW